MTPGPQTTKEKIDKLGLHQNNKLCVSKDIIKKVKKKNNHRMKANMCKAYIS